MRHRVQEPVEHAAAGHAFGAQPEQVGAAGAQLLRGAVRPVAQVVDGPSDPGRGVRADQVRRIQDVGHGLPGHAGSGRNRPECRPVRPSGHLDILVARSDQIASPRRWNDPMIAGVSAWSSRVSIRARWVIARSAVEPVSDGEDSHGCTTWRQRSALRSPFCRRGTQPCGLPGRVVECAAWWTPAPVPRPSPAIWSTSTPCSAPTKTSSRTWTTRPSGWCSAPRGTGGPALTRVQPRPHPGHHPGDLRVPGGSGHRRSAVHRRRHPCAVRPGHGHGAGGVGRQRGHRDARRRTTPGRPRPRCRTRSSRRTAGAPTDWPTASSSLRPTIRPVTAVSSTTRPTAARPTPMPPAG